MTDDVTPSLIVAGAWSVVSGFVMTYYSRALASVTNFYGRKALGRTPSTRRGGPVWWFILCGTLSLALAGALTFMLGLSRLGLMAPP